MLLDELLEAALLLLLLLQGGVFEVLSKGERVTTLSLEACGQQTGSVHLAEKLGSFTSSTHRTLQSEHAGKRDGGGFAGVVVSGEFSLFLLRNHFITISCIFAIQSCKFIKPSVTFKGSSRSN